MVRWITEYRAINPEAVATISVNRRNGVVTQLTVVLVTGVAYTFTERDCNLDAAIAKLSRPLEVEMVQGHED